MIELKNVKKSYNGKVVFEDVNLKLIVKDAIIEKRNAFVFIGLQVVCLIHFNS